MMSEDMERKPCVEYMVLLWKGSGMVDERRKKELI